MPLNHFHEVFDFSQNSFGLSLSARANSTHLHIISRVYLVGCQYTKLGVCVLLVAETKQPCSEQ